MISIYKKLQKNMDNLNLRFRIVMSFILVVFCAIVLISTTMTYYNRNIIMNLMSDNSRQVMKEVNSEVNGLFGSINQLYYTFNSQMLYKIMEQNPGLSEFQQMRVVLQYENEVKEALIANGLQKTVSGVLFYAGEDYCTYIGTGAIAENYEVESADWYEHFTESDNKKVLYGPFLEDFRPEYATEKQVLLYMRYWNIPVASGISKADAPFMMFVIDMDAIEAIFERFAGDNQGIFAKNSAGDIFYTGNLREQEDIAWIREVISTEQIAESTPYVQNKWFISTAHNEWLDWELYMVKPTGTVFSQLTEMMRSTVFITLFTLVAAIACWVIMSRKIVMPITTLNRLISTIEEENDTFITVAGEDDISQIGSRFNAMKRKIQDMNARMYLLEVQEKDAQLSALQSQINPHFLYNTLDNIYCIAQIEEIDSVVKLSENLSAMMRYSMNMRQRVVPITSELEHVKNYIQIINVRFDDSITLHIDMEEHLSECRMLKLILQPLVENAWSHGILPGKAHKGTINLRIWEEEACILVEVRDDGIGITQERSDELNAVFASEYDTEVVSQKGFGVALKNVNNRIKLYCGEAYGLHIAPDVEMGCVVRVRLRKELEES